MKLYQCKGLNLLTYFLGDELFRIFSEWWMSCSMHCLLRWNKLDTFYSCTIGKNVTFYTYDFINKNVPYFIYEKCHIWSITNHIHSFINEIFPSFWAQYLIHEILHIWDNICIKSITFGPSQSALIAHLTYTDCELLNYMWKDQEII